MSKKVWKIHIKGIKNSKLLGKEIYPNFEQVCKECENRRIAKAKAEKKKGKNGR